MLWLSSLNKSKKNVFMKGFWLVLIPSLPPGFLLLLTEFSIHLPLFSFLFKMSDFLSNNALFFVGGMLSGTFLTFLLYKCVSSNKVKTNENGAEMEYDYVSGTNYGTNKLVLVVRTDLKMGKGKVAAQCSHAAVLAHEASQKKCPDIFHDWKRNGQPKIVVKVDNEDEMLDLAKQAKKHQLLVNIVQDAGRTQVASGSRTVLAVGPGPESVINEVTGHLRLY